MHKLVLDTETTGLDKKKDRILELAVLEIDENGCPTGRTFHRYINPQRNVPEEAAAVHGMTTEKLKDCPLFKDVVSEFLDFVKGRDIIIHNAPYDVGMLDAELARLESPAFATFVASVTDSLALSRLVTKSDSHTLDTLCDRYGVDRSKRTLHGALLDCEMLGMVLPHLMAEDARIRAQIAAFEHLALKENPEDLDSEEAGRRYLELASVLKRLEKLQEPYEEILRERAGGMDLMLPTVVVEFSTSTSTKWEDFKKAFAPEADIAPFQKKTARMTILRK